MNPETLEEAQVLAKAVAEAAETSPAQVYACIYTDAGMHAHLHKCIHTKMPKMCTQRETHTRNTHT